VLHRGDSHRRGHRAERFGEELLRPLRRCIETCRRAPSWVRISSTPAAASVTSRSSTRARSLSSFAPRSDQDLRLRRLPGSLPLEPFRVEDRESGFRRAAGTTNSGADSLLSLDEETFRGRYLGTAILRAGRAASRGTWRSRWGTWRCAGDRTLEARHARRSGRDGARATRPGAGSNRGSETSRAVHP